MSLSHHPPIVTFRAQPVFTKPFALLEPVVVDRPYPNITRILTTRQRQGDSVNKRTKYHQTQVTKPPGKYKDLLLGLVILDPRHTPQQI